MTDTHGRVHVTPIPIQLYTQPRMDDEARDAFDGFSAMFNIRGYGLRRGKEADKSAEEGISPWKIGMLAACLLLWDIMWKVCFAINRFCACHVSCVVHDNHIITGGSVAAHAGLNINAQSDVRYLDPTTRPAG